MKHQVGTTQWQGQLQFRINTSLISAKIFKSKIPKDFQFTVMKKGQEYLQEYVSYQKIIFVK